MSVEVILSIPVNGQYDFKQLRCCIVSEVKDELPFLLLFCMQIQNLPVQSTSMDIPAYTHMFVTRTQR